jgi:hypothetical protein
MEIMPEFAVHHAIHLLVFRPETPSGGLHRNHNDSVEDDKMLRKRLVWLFDPLVKSLGESADNISFLLRLSEMLGRSYIPRDCGIIEKEHGNDDLSISSNVSNRELLQKSKLKVICAAAREVLMKYVKKDVNLTPYPGIIQINASLFAQNKGDSPSPINIHDEGSESTEEGVVAEKTTVTDSEKKSSPSFSQSVASTASKLSSSKIDLDELLLSPILKPASPEFRNLNTPISARHEKLGVSFESLPSTESVDKRRGGRSLSSSKDKRRRTSASSNTSTIKSHRSNSDTKSSANPTQKDDLEFDTDHKVSDTKPSRTKALGKGKRGRKSADKTPIKIGTTSQPARTTYSPASIGSRSTRSTKSTQGSTPESPQSSTTSVRRSSRLSRD